MIKNLARNIKLSTLFLTIIIFTTLILVSALVYATPIGPTVSILSNTSKAVGLGTKTNTTINGTISPGGYIFTTSVTSTQQNIRWKGYVGNVTGTLTLDDANDNTLFSWTLGTSIAGEVYATRASGNINWTGINCTWIGDIVNQSNRLSTNRSIELAENNALSHTNVDDNITATFKNQNHTSITIGSRIIGKDNCYSVQTYQRDAAQAFTDSNTANFTQVILFDGAPNQTTGNVVYETKIESDLTGYRTDSTYDFQMILPENGAVGFTSSTAYYFYVELT